jgi:hypothetical protein
VKPEAHLFMVHNIDKPACSAKHEATLVEIIDDDPPCTLKCTRVMVDQILNAYMASALSRAASD